MKRLLSAALVLLVLARLSLPALALTYVDDFTDSGSNTIKSYTNLSYFSMDAAYWSGLPDRSAFSFASAATPVGAASYRVRGATQVKVGFYTLWGSFVNTLPDGRPVLGLHQEDAAGLSAGAQAGYSPAAKAVYARIDGALHKAYAGEGAVVFLPAAESPADLVGYGVNVYTSTGGQSWSRVALGQTRLTFQAGSPFVYEELSGAIPAGTQYVRVELNDVNALPVQGKPGSFQQKAAKSYNCIASVAFSGASLTLGVPEPVQTEPTSATAATEPEEDESGKESSKASSSSTKSSSSGSARTAGSPSAAAGSSKAASSSAPTGSLSKFEGVIELPQSTAGSRTAATQQASPAPTVPATAEPASTESTPTLPADGDMVYRIASNSGDDKHFTAGVTAYIIVVTGALAFIVLASGAKKK